MPLIFQQLTPKQLKEFEQAKKEAIDEKYEEEIRTVIQGERDAKVEDLARGIAEEIKDREDDWYDGRAKQEREGLL